MRTAVSARRESHSSRRSRLTAILGGRGGRLESVAAGMDTSGRCTGCLFEYRPSNALPHVIPGPNGPKMLKALRILKIQGPRSRGIAFRAVPRRPPLALTLGRGFKPQSPRALLHEETAALVRARACF